MIKLRTFCLANRKLLSVFVLLSANRDFSRKGDIPAWDTEDAHSERFEIAKNTTSKLEYSS